MRKSLIITAASFLLITFPVAALADNSISYPGVGVVVNPDGSVVGTIGVGDEGHRQPVLPPVAEITQPYLPNNPAPDHETKYPDDKPGRNLPDCGFRIGYAYCTDKTPDPTPTQPTTAPPIAELDIAPWAAIAATQIQLPTPTPQIGPDPTLNEWNMVAVRYPIWLSIADTTTKQSSITTHGVTLQLQASYSHTSYNMGDGNTITCYQNTPWNNGVKPGTPSPNCGYRYLKVPPNKKATITATTTWNITWTSQQQTGKLTTTRQANRTIDIGELTSIINK